MTIADKARAHRLWKQYVQAREIGDAELVLDHSSRIATDLGLTERQRLVNLPKIAAQTGARGRPRIKERCPHCGK